MLLRGGQAGSVELQLVNPAGEGWLVVDGNVVHPRGRWSFRDHCLQLDEAEALAAWIKAAANGKPNPERLSFLEPLLQFEYRNEAKPIVRAIFRAEARPPWCKDEFMPTTENYVDLPVGSAEFDRAAKEMYDQLRRLRTR
jgi:hypothetical protein